jgi:sugar O-acyltransferase (sialic acid O-acetyltransferase NeuD family)
MTQPLIILGTGGSAYDVLDIVEAINAVAPTWHVAGFLDDAREVGSQQLGFAALGALREAGRFEECWFLNVIGSDRSYHRRQEILATTELGVERFATLVHPKAAVSSYARLGRDVYVAAGASIGGGVTVEDHVGVSPGAIVGHDTSIESYSMIAPGAVVSGFVHIGRGAYVGAGAVVRQHLRIGTKALVGMGAVVVRDVPDEAIVVGNPARPLSSRRAE